MAICKVSAATPLQLDWLVAKCEGMNVELIGIKDDDDPNKFWHNATNQSYQFSTRWSQGGPIIEREKIAIDWNPGGEDGPFWCAHTPPPPTHRDPWPHGYGTTPLIAAMRCYLASKMGDEVEVPEDLK